MGGVSPFHFPAPLDAFDASSLVPQDLDESYATERVRLYISVLPGFHTDI